MKFTTSKKNFIEAITISSRAVASKNNMPILSGIYIKTKENIAEFQATNHELGFIIQIEANIEEEGSVVLSGKYLTEISKKLPGDTVTFNYSETEKIAHISSGSSNYRLLSLNGEFLEIEKLENNISINIKSNDLSKMIKKTTFAAATDDTRAIYTGCLFEINEENFTLVATNTHRLVINNIRIDNTEKNITAIIPAKALNELLYAIKEDDPYDITITISNNKISFEFLNVYMTTSLIAGEYPNYKRVIPVSHKTFASVDRETFTSVVDRVSFISRYNEFHALNFNINENSIHMLSTDPEIGKAEEDLPANVEGENLSISFNVQYITEVLKVLEGEKIKMYFNNSLDPMRLEDPENPGFSYVVTPVRNPVA